MGKFERESWFTSQRKQRGPDWVKRILPNDLNRSIENVVRDLYHGNIGTIDLNNPDFRDLCSKEISDALLGYYSMKRSNMEPIYFITDFYKKYLVFDIKNRASCIDVSERDTFIKTEMDKIALDINNKPTFHFIDEVFRYYSEACNLLEGFITSGYTNYSFIVNLCSLVYKSNNRWGNPSVRFV